MKQINSKTALGFLGYVGIAIAIWYVFKALWYLLICFMIWVSEYVIQ